MKNVLIICVITLFFTSCISTEELTYFQGNPKDSSTVQKHTNIPYKLQVNDIIDIKIKAADPTLVALFNTSENRNNSNISLSSQNLYFNSYSVDKNGFVRIPYLGEINVLGYTEKEVRLKIESELAKMFKDMNSIFVTVKLAGIRFTVLGEVSSPGNKVVFQNTVNLMEAIASSGDITLTGNRKEIEIIRNNIDGIKKFTVDVTSFDFINTEAYFIQPNDIINIKPLKEKSWGTGQTGTKTLATIVSALSLLTTVYLLAK